MSTNREKPSGRLPWAIAGLLAFVTLVIAFNIPLGSGLSLALLAWWCIIVIVDDAPVFKRVAILTKLRGMFHGNGWRPVLAFLAVGLFLAVPAEFARHNRFAKPFLYIGMPAAFLGAFGLVMTIGQWSDKAIYEIRHWLSIKAERLREALRPAIVKVALSELDALQTEIAPRIDRFMTAESARLKGAYVIERWEASALSSERYSMKTHQEAAYRAARNVVTVRRGTEIKKIVKTKKSIDLFLIKTLRDNHRLAVLEGRYLDDTFFGIIEPITRTAFFCILNEMLAERGGQTVEEAVADMDELKAAIAARVEAARSAG